VFRIPCVVVYLQGVPLDNMLIRSLSSNQIGSALHPIVENHRECDVCSRHIPEKSKTIIDLMHILGSDFVDVISFQAIPAPLFFPSLSLSSFHSI
jgi:hypothetical protein